MRNHAQVYDTPEDCQWLRDTALRGYETDTPDFGSFTIAGNEDCPLEIRLYAQVSPMADDPPVAMFVLEQNSQSTLSQYRRREG